MSTLADWDFDLPPERIARYPADRREGSRLLVLPRDGGSPRHLRFESLPELLQPGDLLVGNDTRVLPARLSGTRPTGGRAELLVLDVRDGPVRALARPARKLRPGTRIALDGGGHAQILGPGPAPGEVLVQFEQPVLDVLDAQGAMPLPPYLNRPAEPADRVRYQTVYAGPPGAAAAPTAGLHFSDALLARLAATGVGFTTVTLHVGLGTFRPLTDDDVARGTLHSEWYEVSQAAAAAIASARAGGGRIIAIGTTAARTLESATRVGADAPTPGAATTELFVRPPYDFRSVDGLITNFHLPRSSLLMLVAALCGRERLLAAYAQAIELDYRFYSYGDAMLLLPGGANG